MKIISYIPPEPGKVDSFWIACSKEEAEKWFIPLLDENGLRWLQNWFNDCERRMRDKDQRQGYEQMIKETMHVNELAYAYFCVARDLSKCYANVAHHPFHQLWNGYSPFLRCDQVDINSPDELKDIVMTLDGRPISEIVAEERAKKQE
jgi:hypothetical protein